MTRTERTEHITTSKTSSVSIDIEPKSVVHTSPAIFDELANMFVTRYPRARAPTESIAIAASPLIFESEPRLRSSTAQITVTGKTTIISPAISKTVAIDNAPNATCESPSPINEKRFNTNVTPKSDEHRAIRTPTIRAYITNGYRSALISSFIFSYPHDLMLTATAFAFDVIFFSSEKSRSAYIKNVSRVFHRRRNIV